MSIFLAIKGKPVSWTLLGLGCAGVFGMTRARAEEDWFPHLAGIGEGQAAGALPPTGVYLFNELDWTQSNFPGPDKTPPVTTTIAVDVPILIWVPGVRFLGADYASAIVLPFDYVSTFGPGAPGRPRRNLGTRGGTYDTVVIPGELSWALPGATFVKAGLDIFIPDGDYEKPQQVAFPNSIGFWVVEPTLGITYAPAGWNFSAAFYYDRNFANSATNYTSGDVFGGDYTAMKTIGKWGFGVGGYSQTQFNADVENGRTVPDSKYSNYGIGPILSYDFGPVSVQAIYNHRLANPHMVQTDEFWTDVTYRF